MLLEEFDLEKILSDLRTGYIEEDWEMIGEAIDEIQKHLDFLREKELSEE
ncbi:MAG: hypothetical protein H8E13_01725 [Actinobacteria bacterium]|nr:hypothetical protein [Actinomycetota bacterium]